MADRVKYFVLGLLFLVVAGVIAYDNWNSKGTPDQVVADGGNPDRAHVTVGREKDSLRGTTDERGGDLSITPPPETHTLPESDPPETRTLPAERKAEAKPETESRINPQTKPATKPKSAPRPAPQMRDRTHVVQSGESLEKIAIKYYGTRKGVAWIVERNGLANPNRIYAKQKLIIPARKELNAPATKKTSRKTAKPAGKIPSRYTVKSGEDLYAICRRFYGSKGLAAQVDRVMDLNQLWKAEVKPGAVLILPPK